MGSQMNPKAFGMRWKFVEVCGRNKLGDSGGENFVWGMHPNEMPASQLGYGSRVQRSLC